MAAVVATVIMSLYTNADIHTTKNSLEAAVTFYSRGFKLISDALQNKLAGYSFERAEPAGYPSNSTTNAGDTAALRLNSFWYAVGQVVYSIFFRFLMLMLPCFF
jgi:hypothetical protein